MSELNATNSRCSARNQFLATASAMALAAYVGFCDAAKAEDVSRPTVWVEMGGQMDFLQGVSRPFTAPFMSMQPVPAPEGADFVLPPNAYNPNLFHDNQRPARRAFGLEGKILFQPEDSEWTFSAAIRYGRAQTNRHAHEQGPSPYKYFNNNKIPLYAAEFGNEESASDQSHMFLDFQVGKDVGLGVLGNDGASNVSLGLRLAQISVNASVAAIARPRVDHFYKYANYDRFELTGEQQRNFRAVGPSVSWNASAALMGNRDNAQVTLDWGFNGAVLFGQQKAHVVHSTSATNIGKAPSAPFGPFVHTPLYVPRDGDVTRSRSVTVPNVGAFAGLSVRYPYARVSFGYRADFLMGAMDIGLDSRKTTTTGFHGPFAKIAIGLGG